MFLYLADWSKDLPFKSLERLKLETSDSAL